MVGEEKKWSYVVFGNLKSELDYEEYDEYLLLHAQYSGERIAAYDYVMLLDSFGYEISGEVDEIVDVDIISIGGVHVNISNYNVLACRIAGEF